jgi:hypothetical protein
MHFLARQILAVSVQKWLSREGATHSALIGIPVPHMIGQYGGKKPGYTDVSPGSFNSCPASDIFFESNGHVAEPILHNTNIV